MHKKTGQQDIASRSLACIRRTFALLRFYCMVLTCCLLGFACGYLAWALRCGLFDLMEGCRGRNREWRCLQLPNERMSSHTRYPYGCG